MWLETRLKKKYLQAIFKAQRFRMLMTQRSFYAISSRASWQAEKQLLFVNSFWRSERFIDSFVFHANPGGFKSTGSTELNRWDNIRNHDVFDICMWTPLTRYEVIIITLVVRRVNNVHGLCKRFAFLIEKFPERHVKKRTVIWACFERVIVIKRIISVDVQDEFALIFHRLGNTPRLKCEHCSVIK